jgi:hypothetical protein
MSKSNGHTSELYSPEAERGTLGCLIQNPPLVIPHLEQAGVIAPWFYDLRHSLWYNLLRQMHSRGEGIDHITVHNRLLRATNAKEFGGIEYYLELEGAAPSAHNWAYYLPDLRSLFVRRKTIEAATRIVSLAKDLSQEPDQLLSELNSSLESLVASRHSLPPVVDAATFVDSQITLPDELVKGLLHKGLKFSLGGGSKTCKSWVLLDLAISVANGSEWLGIKTNPAKVLFVNLEIPTAFFRKRMAKVCLEKDITLKTGCFDVWNLRGYNASFDDLLPKIISAAREMGYGLIIIDPIYKIYGGLKENAAEDMSQLMGRLEGVAHETGAAIGFAAHFSKGNQAQKDALDRISGSGVFARDPDTCMTMTALKQESSFAFAADGLRNFAPFKPFAIEWKYPLMRRNDDLDPGELKQAGGRPKTYNEAKIAALLEPKPLSTSEWQKMSAAELGTSKSSFFRALEDLKFTQSVAKGATDGKWFLTVLDKSQNSDADSF